PGRRIYYYRMQNAKAQDVARSLSAVYGNAVSYGAGESSGSEYPDASPPGSSPPNAAPEAGPPPPPMPAASTGPRASSGSGLQIAVDEANNALIIRADTAEYAGLERFLKEIDVAPDQVLIEVTIAEVTLNDTLKYGVEWFFKNNDQTFNLS